MFLSNWEMGQEIEATFAMLEVPGADTKQLRKDLFTRIAALRYYWDEDPAPPGYDAATVNISGIGSKCFDDNVWVGLAFLDIYETYLHEPWLLERAIQLFELQEYAAELALELPHPGGVRWAESDGGDYYTATVSTAGAAQLALRLYRITGDVQYLTFAREKFAWVDRNLRSREGLYIDGIKGDGSKNHALYSYNQGLMLGNATLLFQVTGDPNYLAVAQNIANAALHYYRLDLWSQNPFFTAVFFQNLLRLHAISPLPNLRVVMEKYADRLMDNMNRQNNVMTYNAKGTSLDQSGAVRIFSMLAMAQF